MYIRSYALPWTLAEEDDKRYNRVLLWSLAAAAVLGLVIPALPVRDTTLLAPPELPARMAKLLLEPKPKPPEPEFKPPPEPEQAVVREKPVAAPIRKAIPVPVVEMVKPVPEPVDRQAARNRAANAGVMAFADQLADLRDTVADESLQRDTRTAATGDAPAQRALITSANSKTSAGIDTAAMSRATGGGGLATRQTTRVTTPATPKTARTVSNTRKHAASGARSREQIEQVFDRNKAAIYALYRRALRSNPTLEGKVVLTLTIAPSGAVTEVQILSSELAAPELEAKLLRRIKMFDFGARDVAVTTTTKPIDFFPA